MGLMKGIDTAETVFDGRNDKVLNIFAVGEHGIEGHGHQAIDLGNKLIAIKSQLQRGHWLPRVQDRSGMSYGICA